MENNTKLTELFKNVKLKSATTPEERRAAIVAHFRELVKRVREKQQQNQDAQE